MGNWYRLPKGEGWFLVGIFLYAGVFFLPWSYDVMILHLTLQAWGAYALHLIAPVVAIYLIIRSKSKEVNIDSERSNRSFDT
ncbi:MULTISPECIES: hypothetical protein [Bacillaceae]|uniref:hypothetical protein n=1 Tax=Bacillaceae TaxID=186817 RepID=UPI0006D236C1|nr:MULTISPECIES: hypothetical protein [Bacillaceae]